MDVVRGTCSCFFKIFAGVCKLAAWLTVIVACICIIFGIITIKKNPSGEPDSSDQRRSVGYGFLMGGLILLVIGLVTCCCAYQLKVCKRCLQGRTKSSGGGRQVVIIQNVPRPAPQPAAPQEPRYVPPHPLPQPREHQYVPPQQPSHFLPYPQFPSQSNSRHRPTSPPTNPQMNQQYDLSQPAHNPYFTPFSQLELQEPSGQLVYPPNQTQYTPVFYPTSHYNQQQSNSGPLDAQENMHRLQPPPAYQQLPEIPSAPPPADKAYNQQ